jgi:hypothetical protein
MAASCTSPQVPRVFTLVSTRFRSPTSARQGLHLAQALVHLLQPVADQLEAFAQALLQRGVQLLVDGARISSSLAVLSAGWRPSAR